MSRAPELGDECRPGGSCPDCGDTRPECFECYAIIEHEDVVKVRVGGKLRDFCQDCAADDAPDEQDADDAAADAALNWQREAEV